MGWFRTTKEQADAAFDRERGLLYVLQPLADEEWTIVHVWRID
jgi:hypothetical protein